MAGEERAAHGLSVAAALATAALATAALATAALATAASTTAALATAASALTAAGAAGRHLLQREHQQPRLSRRERLPRHLQDGDHRKIVVVGPPIEFERQVLDGLIQRLLDKRPRAVGVQERANHLDERRKQRAHHRRLARPGGAVKVEAELTLGSERGT